MNLYRKLLVVLGVILIGGLMVIPAYAQSPEIVTAEVDRPSLTTDDTLTLTVYIDESYGTPGQPQLPPLDGFQVLGASRGTQMSIINGNMSIRSTYTYRLTPSQAGNFIIDPIVVLINGQAYASLPIAVEVTQGNGQPTSPSTGSFFGSLFPSFPGFPNMNSPSFPSLPSLPGVVTTPSGPVTPMDPAEAPDQLAGQAYYLESRVDNPNPYLGEQIVHTLRLYQPAGSFYQPEYQPPSFGGFWSQAEADQSNLSLQYARRDYQVIEIKTILVPTVIDQIAIDAAAIEIPGGFFSSGQSFRSNPINVDVRPLPEGAPPSFSGAVGKFQIGAEADTLETIVNDTVTMKITLSGRGNIETMGDPQWPDMPGWRAFDSQVATESHFEDGLLTGVREYERLLVPTEPGILALPSVEFTYFDPETEEYKTISTEPVSITVADDGSSHVRASRIPAASFPSSPFQPLNDIRPLKSSPPTWSVGENLLIKNAGYWFLWTIPLMFFTLHAAGQHRQRRRSKNVNLRRNKGAQKQALKALREIQKDGAGNSEDVGPILIIYLENKLNLSLSGVTHPAIAKLMIDRGVDEVLVERFQNALLLSEMGRFAPEELAGPAGDIIGDAKGIIKDLDKVL